MVRIPLDYDLRKALLLLAQIRDHYTNFPFIRTTAISIGNPQANDDQEGMLSRITRFVRDRVIYVEDPVGFEWVTAPDVMLADIMQKGRSHGDCDDHAMLLGTMLQSVGIRTKFEAVKLSPNDTEFNHVIITANLRGEWIDLDPTIKSVAQPHYQDRLIVE